MSKLKVRPYSRLAIEAGSLLGKLIKMGRKKHNLTIIDLAARARVSRDTVQKIEKGDLSCNLGFAFELAAIVGVKLFDADLDELHTHIKRVDDRLTLLPKYTRKPKEIDNDF